VDTGLLRVEVDEAFEVGVVQGFIVRGAAVLAGADGGGDASGLGKG
jgi:hypothetical protein